MTAYIKTTDEKKSQQVRQWGTDLYPHMRHAPHAARHSTNGASL